MMAQPPLHLLILLAITLLSRVSQHDCAGMDSPIQSAMSAGIGPVGREIGGIQEEIEGSVFPSASPPSASLLTRSPVSRLLDRLPRPSRHPLVAVFTGAEAVTSPPEQPSLTAHVDIVGDAQYYPGISGHITLTQVKGGPVMLVGSVRGLPRSGLFAMHFHENPAVPGNCAVVGEHFNPLHMRHGGPNDVIRHIGDEGNIVVSAGPGDGVAHIVKSDFMISLRESVINSVIGRSLTIHARTDDLGKGVNRESGKSGNSGEKIACGTVTLSHEG